MGGIRAVYLRGASARYAVAQGEQSIGDVYVVDDAGFPGVRNWALRFSEADGQSLDLMTVAEIVECIVSTGAVSPFRRVATQRTGAKLESTVQTSENGNSFVEHVLTLPLAGLTPEASRYIYSLMGADVTAIVVTWSGAWLGFGFDSPARLSGGGSTTGSTWGDAPGNSIQLTAQSAGPLPVDPALIGADGQDGRKTVAQVEQILKDAGIVVDPN